jgi:hypothetical protein
LLDPGYTLQCNHYEGLIFAQETIARRKRSLLRATPYQEKQRKRAMSSKQILSTLSAGFVMALLAVSCGAGAAAADGQRNAMTAHRVHKAYIPHRLYDYAGHAPYVYGSADREGYGPGGLGYRYGRYCTIPTAYSIYGICYDQ